ncbi:putative kinesin-like protein KIF18A-like [Apostichopus japonicus]|uniref:Kinesin-like protein n=1 Tax=Stichopus japonicus TaxID=307972 RepID=A0A2G8LQS0_STIJA|nr:putative kinesin-like protein KIF18A-like [Apostichopus japonicus]
MPSKSPRNLRTPSRGGKGQLKVSSSQHPDDQCGADNSNVRVVVRLRPMNDRETQANSNSIIHVLDENVLIFDPKPENSPSHFYHGKRVRHRNMLKRKNRDLRFAFDHVFDGSSTQDYVYENTTRTIVDSVLTGFNASVFAYGATGAGKTHTMLGAGSESPGVIYLTMVELYQKISAMQSEKSCNVTVSYLEVYNETVKDLIKPSGPLAIRKTQNGVLVSGLSVHKPKSAEELFQMLEFGNQNRTQHPTDANKQSSRSHAVFQVFVRQKDRTAGLKADVGLAKMSLIDLAGSERATVTTNRGARFREGANINKSLLALGNCINALADAKRKGHVPYRNSKLTRLLKDSLGGNCKTVMIAAISPSHLSFEDTYNTLRYANRTKDIKTNLKRNIISVNYHVTKYAKIVDELRAEVAELKTKLKKQDSQSSLSTAVIPQPDEKTLRYQLEFNKIFSQRTSMRKELLELESSDRNLTAKIMRKEMIAERIKLIHGDSSLGEKTTSKFEKVISSTRKRQERLKERKAAVELRCQENEVVFQGLNEDVKKTGSVSDMLKSQFIRCHILLNEKYSLQSLKDHLQSRQMEIEIRDSRVQTHQEVLQASREPHPSSENCPAPILHHQRFRSSLRSSQQGLESVQKQVRGVKEVAWRIRAYWKDRVVNTSSEGQEEDNSLNYLLGLPILRCEIQSPRVPTPKNNRRLTFPAKSGSPQVTEHAKSGKSQPTAEITSTPTGVVDSVSSHRNPFATLSTNSPNLGRHQVTLVKSKGIEETIKPGYVKRNTPHGKVKRYAILFNVLENWYDKTVVGYSQGRVRIYCMRV